MLIALENRSLWFCWHTFPHMLFSMPAAIYVGKIKSLFLVFFCLFVLWIFRMKKANLLFWLDLFGLLNWSLVNLKNIPSYCSVCFMFVYSILICIQCTCNSFALVVKKILKISKNRFNLMSNHLVAIFSPSICSWQAMKLFKSMLLYFCWKIICSYALYE